jgi:hypothetical protein
MIAPPDVVDQKASPIGESCFQLVVSGAEDGN